MSSIDSWSKYAWQDFLVLTIVTLNNVLVGVFFKSW